MEEKNNREKVQKIKNIIEKEIEKELLNKQNEVTDISEKIKNILRSLDILKYIVAVNYYDQNTSLTQKKSGQEEENEDDKAQTQIHPCIKKLMPFRSNYNKSFGDAFSSHSYETRNSRKNNFSESVNNNNNNNNSNNNNKETSSHSSQKICNNLNKDIKLPQYIPPLPNEEETIGTVNSSRGSMSKESFRVIVGNISKWIPPDTREDNSTHKWMVYIRNRDPKKDITKLLKKVRYFLHESYKPHDIIDVTSPPFRLTRRGWGEFPIRVQLHFLHPLDKPVDIIHNLKLDMTYSGIQMLGGETVIEISLHQNSSIRSNEKNISKPDLNLKNEMYKKAEGFREKEDVFDGNLLTSINGIKPNNCVVDVKKENEMEDMMIKQEPEECFESMKLLNSKMEEMDEALNNSRKFLLDRRKIMKIIEIEHGYLKTEGSQLSYEPLNNFTNSVIKSGTVKTSNFEQTLKNGAILKPTQMNQLMKRKNQYRLSKIEVRSCKSEEEIFQNLKAAASKIETESQSKYSMIMFRQMYLVNVVQRAHATNLKSIESLIRWFVQRWPIITKLSLDPTYKTVHPYSSPSEEEFFKYNIGKQRSAEWFRAKSIQKVLKSLKAIIPIEEEIWSTKQILLWSRFHGYIPSQPQKNPKIDSRENESRNKRLKLNESSSDSDEETFEFYSKKSKTAEERFLNGLNLGERKRSQRKCKRKDLFDEGSDKTIRNYMECNTCSQASDPLRFGTDQFFVLQSSDLSSDIEVVEVEEKPVIENPSKKKEINLSVITTPPCEILFNKFVVDTAKQIGVKISEEETIPGVKTDSVSRVLSQCVTNFVDELLRRSFAQAWIRNGERCPDSLELNDVLATLIERHRFDIFTNRGLGVPNAKKS